MLSSNSLGQLARAALPSSSSSSGQIAGAAGSPLLASSSMGQLAGALARAQVELVNPAKTLTATLELGRGRGEGQTYRYAPLSAGLDIIRRALGQQEIAVLQTTAMQ